jgi:hypothetical protein
MEELMSAGNSFRRAVNPESGHRWISAVVLAGVLGFCLVGCGSQELMSPEPPKETPPPPPVATASVAAPTDRLWEEAQKFLDDRQHKLAVAGGAALLLAIIVGVGVGKILRGSPTRPEGRA